MDTPGRLSTIYEALPGGRGITVPLFLWNISAFFLVPLNQNLNFLCSLLPKITFVPPVTFNFRLVFPCSPEINDIIALFPIIPGRSLFIHKRDSFWDSTCNHFWNRVYSKTQEFALTEGKPLPHRIDHLQIEENRLANAKVYSVPLHSEYSRNLIHLADLPLFSTREITLVAFCLVSYTSKPLLKRGIL